VFDSAVIQLSDIECGPWHRGEDPSFTYPDGYAACDRRLIEDVRAQLEEYDMSGAKVGLIITGDIAATGDEKEYKKSEASVKRIQDAFDIPPSRIAIVPGNHDVSWASCWTIFESRHPGDPDPAAADRVEARSYPEKVAPFAAFLEAVTGRRFERPEDVIEYPGFLDLHIALVGLDTTFLCTFTEEDNHGWLNEAPIRKAGERLQAMRKDHPLAYPIAAIHHAAYPAADDVGADGSYFMNASQARDWFNDAGFAVILCGHGHFQSALADVVTGQLVLQAGSYGIDGSKLKERYPGDPLATNSYQLLLLGPTDPGRCLLRSLRIPGKPDSGWIPGSLGGKRIPWADVRRSLRLPRAGEVVPKPGNPVRLALRPRTYVVSISLEAEDAVLDGLTSVDYEIAGSRVPVPRRVAVDRFWAEVEFELQPGDAPWVKTVLHYDRESRSLTRVPLPAENATWNVTGPPY
jgi:hypothetical protein